MPKYATYINFAGCDLCMTKKKPLTVKGPGDTLFCSDEHRDIYLQLAGEEEQVTSTVRMSKAQKIAQRLRDGHRVFDIMREDKVSYAYVKGVKDELEGTLSGTRITLHGFPFRCSCGGDVFTNVYRTDEYTCNSCGGRYEADPRVRP